jgi:hypothetical protein
VPVSQARLLLCRSPEAERKLNEPLKGVLKEVALTGVIRYCPYVAALWMLPLTIRLRFRYDWSLIRPLLSTLLKEVLDDFHAEAVSEVSSLLACLLVAV